MKFEELGFKCKSGEALASFWVNEEYDLNIFCIEYVQYVLRDTNNKNLRIFIYNSENFEDMYHYIKIYIRKEKLRRIGIK